MNYRSFEDGSVNITSIDDESLPPLRLDGHRGSPLTDSSLLAVASRAAGFACRSMAGAVTALAFHPAKAQLASGSKDTNIIVWDVLAESGLFRLRGHTDQVTLPRLHMRRP